MVKTGEAYSIECFVEVMLLGLLLVVHGWVGGSIVVRVCVCYCCCYCCRAGGWFVAVP